MIAPFLIKLTLILLITGARRLEGVNQFALRNWLPSPGHTIVCSVTWLSTMPGRQWSGTWQVYWVKLVNLDLELRLRLSLSLLVQPFSGLFPGLIWDSIYPSLIQRCDFLVPLSIFPVSFAQSFSLPASVWFLINLFCHFYSLLFSLTLFFNYTLKCPWDGVSLKTTFILFKFLCINRESCLNDRNFDIFLLSGSTFGYILEYWPTKQLKYMFCAMWIILI